MKAFDTAVRPPASPEMSFACFDVFDTLLSLSVGRPEDMFLLLGRRLLRAGVVGCPAEVFARSRRQAEARAFGHDDLHPTLHEICRELARGLNLADGAAKELVEAELALIRELLRAVPSAGALVEQARAAGRTVVFVTDTNLSAAFIEEILSAHGFFRQGDRVFASCECRVDKARGLLFPHVAGALRARRRVLVHHGNDAVADVRNGRLSGWTVRHLPEANLNRYERALASECFATGGVSSLLASASRTARLARPPADGRERALRTVAAGVMAPLLTAWVIWTMRRAVRAGLGRLYFISRDGQVLLDVARRIEPVLRTGLDLRYLYGSRQAVQFAGFPGDVLRDTLRLRVCRLDDVIEALHLRPEEVLPLLPDALRPLAQRDRDLSPAERERVAALLGGEPFRSLLAQRSATVRATVSGYLRQEGWADGVPFGLVDAGWRGSLAGALTATFGDSGLALPSRYFFYGLGDDAHRVAGAANAHKLDAWFFDDASRHGFLPYPASNTSLVEMFCAGDHGAVTGFRTEGDRVVPVFRTPHSPMQEWGLPILRETVADFVDHLAAVLRADPELVDLELDAREAIRKVAELFWLRPTPAEVEHWGSFPVEVNRNNSVVLPLAERIRLGQIAKALRPGGASLRPEHSWPQGTAMSSKLPSRLVLRASFWAKEKAPKFRRRARWLKGRLRRYSFGAHPSGPTESGAGTAAP